jgi:hypothetical protein
VKVRELLAALSGVDPELPVVVILYADSPGRTLVTQEDVCSTLADAEAFAIEAGDVPPGKLPPSWGLKCS